MNVVCRSRETYISSWVEKYELVSAPGIVAAARFIACSIAGLLVASPAVWKTTTLGGRTPTPKVFSVRWLASYAGLPGIEKLWYQRLESFPAATPPSSVSRIQTPITAQRCRAVKYARRPSLPGSAPFVFHRAGWTASILTPSVALAFVPSTPARAETHRYPACRSSPSRAVVRAESEGCGKPYLASRSRTRKLIRLPPRAGRRRRAAPGEPAPT